MQSLEHIVAANAPPDTSAPKKRRKVTSPTQRTLERCRKLGYEAGVVERPWNPHTKKTTDLFGVIDIVAIAPGGILAIQATTGAHHADRRAKILAEPRARAWVVAGGSLELWTWSKRGPGESKRWALRVEAFHVDEGAFVGVDQHDTARQLPPRRREAVA